MSIMEQEISHFRYGSHGIYIIYIEHFKVYIEMMCGRLPVPAVDGLDHLRTNLKPKG